MALRRLPSFPRCSSQSTCSAPSMPGSEEAARSADASPASRTRDPAAGGLERPGSGAPVPPPAAAVAHEHRAEPLSDPAQHERIARVGVAEPRPHRERVRSRRDPAARPRLAEGPTRRDTRPPSPTIASISSASATSRPIPGPASPAADRGATSAPDAEPRRDDGPPWALEPRTAERPADGAPPATPSRVAARLRGLAPIEVPAQPVVRAAVRSVPIARRRRSTTAAREIPRRADSAASDRGAARPEPARRTSSDRASPESDATQP